jgi:crotonobetaine/carnitine-CoA ligase
MSRRWEPDELAEINRWRVIPDRLRHWARTEPDRTFFRCGGGWLTFGQVDSKTDAIAGGLSKIGITKGDRVAVMLPNCEEAYLGILALAKLGAIQVPLNAYLKGEFLRHQLADSGTMCLLSDAPGIAEAMRVRGELSDLRHFVSIGDQTISGAVGFGELVDSELSCPDHNIAARDPMAIMYTSGTTGLPKGCVLSQGYFMFLPRGWFESDWYRPDERVITALPMFHIAGQGMTLMSALQGGLATTFLRSFSAGRFIAQCREAGATAAFGVGPMGMAVLATPPSDGDRDHNLRITVFPPMAPTARQQFQQRFGVGVVSEVYGQTECNPITLSPLDAHTAQPGVLGAPAAWVDVEILDDNDQPVLDGQPGEIAIRPREPMVMFDGYWNNPAATVATSRTLWHHTGDMARRAEDGSLVFFDRKKDAIRRRGENISCVEVEAAIVKHPDIKAVATHAVPSALGEDDLKAWIVAEPGARLTPDGMHAFLVGALPYFAVPRYVELIDELPVNALNRVQKFKLSERGNENAWDFEKLGLGVSRDKRR